MIVRPPVHRALLGRLCDYLEIIQGDDIWPASVEWPLRRVPDDPALLDRLAAEFGPQRLIESGVAVQGDHGQLAISPRLVPGQATLLPLLDRAGALPFDVLLSDGLVLGEEPPAYAALHDYRVAEMLRSSSSCLFLVPTVEEVRICHSLGLAAVPAAGMNCLSLGALRQIEAMSHSSRPLLLPTEGEESAGDETASDDAVPATDPPATETGQVPPHQEAEFAPNRSERRPTDGRSDTVDLPDDVLPAELIFAGWSFVREQSLPGDQMRVLVARLAQAERCLAINLDGLGVWIPTQDDIECIQFCGDVRDRDALREAVLASVDENCYALADVAIGRIAPWQTPDTYLTARSALSQSLRNTESVPELAESHERLLQAEIIHPLLETAVNHPDPIAGTLHMELANISSLLQSQAPFLQHDLIQAGRQLVSRDTRGTLERSIRIRMQLIDRLVRIARELRR